MMIMPSDKDYKLAKQIKQGKRKINPEFVELANWINNEYRVGVLNIKYDLIDNRKKRPRLTIVFELHKDMRKFSDSFTGYFHKEKQNVITEKFDELVNAKANGRSLLTKMLASFSAHKYKVNDLWVVFTSFEPIAKIEANSEIPESEIQKLKKELDNDELWEISRSFSDTTFFLYTDRQVRDFENSETRKIWTKKYFELLDQYNEFGYFKHDSFAIHLDSKENFDNNYQSNWYYYYK